MTAYLYLIGAIIFEVTGTLLLKASQEFTRLLPSLGVVVCYCLTFFLLSKTLRDFEVGMAYAIWCGVGITLVALGGAYFYWESLDLAACLGIGLILVGIVILNAFSDIRAH